MNIPDLSYFKGILISYINEYCPELSGDTLWIDGRSEAAEDTYLALVHQGVPVYYAMETARQQLLEGLQFSTHDLTLDILQKNYPDLNKIAQNKICTAILPQCRQLYNYYLSATSFFQQSSEKAFERLCAGIKKIASNYIKKHGL